MQFRLIYEGPLRSSQREPEGKQVDKRHAHKHEIRKIIHPQLRKLWATNRNLSGEGPTAHVLTYGAPPAEEFGVQFLSNKFNRFGWNFVPLITTLLDLNCSIDILFLRRSRAGSVIQSGDIDNRLKTLFDALTIPTPHDEYIKKEALDTEKPFYCLLEDDKLITKISVETDQLLTTGNNVSKEDDVHLIIEVNIKPYTVKLNNIRFV